MSEPVIAAAVAAILFAAVCIARLAGPPAAEGKQAQSCRGTRHKLHDCRVVAKPIMSGEQARLLADLGPWAAARDLRLHSEVSLSAIFKVSHPRDRKLAFAAFATIRQKYLDILITDARHMPLGGIEYHGSGHWEGKARERDASKRAAFEASGLPLLEVRPGYELDQILAALDASLGRNRAQPVAKPIERLPVPAAR